MPGGRPKKEFKDEYCDMLFDHMKGGLSFQSFGGVVGCCKETLELWVEEYPQFSSAKKRGTAASLIFWEKMGVAGTLGKIKNFNCASWIFNMRNRFGWRNDPITTDSGQQIKIEIVHPKDEN